MPDLVHRRGIEEEARARHLEDGTAVAVVRQLIHHRRHPIRAHAGLPQILPVHRASAGQQHAASGRVERDQLSIGWILRRAPARQAGGAAAGVIEDDVHPTAQHDGHTIDVCTRVAVGVPGLAGDDRRFDRRAVDGLERAARRVAALQPLQFDALQLLRDDLLVSAGRFAAVVRAADEPIRADVRIDVQGERRIQGVCFPTRTGYHRWIAAQLAQHVQHRGDLALRGCLAPGHVQGPALPCSLQLVHLMGPA